MNIVIDQADFRRLSPRTQRELIEKLAGKAMSESKRPRSGAKLFWRRPVDLSADMTVKLVHGLAEQHRKRLELLASGNGRASLKDLLAVTGDSDWHVLSYFQSVLTRRLRRMIEDPERKAELVKWDFDSTKWDADGTSIVDGIYYVSPATAAALREVLKPGGHGDAKTAH
jgi:hypothetical protein